MTSSPTGDSPAPVALLLWAVWLLGQEREWGCGYGCRSAARRPTEAEERSAATPAAPAAPELRNVHATFLVLWGFFILDDFLMSTSVVFTHPGCRKEQKTTRTLYLSGL